MLKPLGGIAAVLGIVIAIVGFTVFGSTHPHRELAAIVVGVVALIAGIVLLVLPSSQKA